MSYNCILASTPTAGVRQITLNRPKALNALNAELMKELMVELRAADADSTIGAIVITGSERAFAAGADIKEMSSLQSEQAIDSAFLRNWGDIIYIDKPIIAAVDGFALGGGCELAMSCDIIYATERAQFGQPEIQLGVIPGAGGTQRLVKAIGKSKAMELVLTGERIKAQQAYDWGLISKVLPDNKALLEAALNLASRIGNGPRLANKMAKACVNKSYEMSLKDGLEFERITFQALFGTRGQTEGMTAFVEKRPAQWKI
ncbi:hypothetical protein BABINDRAFT_31153 [Babjeviella inositovora NRRL Y-12698]|uniref:Probable enoyl-CoA hydratase, mitochondrial n=1 Tax=Babjeviella inositovora NRRL Y-12698 TaxID=984486 RepID=A0A1E3QY96_9ASCO|nr:uncharacterized protein BABINDRAFT_31153 [Babjeviella inositovora NRRL Y-12698]ODQ82640.1 hypothetical protein BABINDRAFT_31153 [Babjeviella inositovora NRRL Y-12698]